MEINKQQSAIQQAVREERKKNLHRILPWSLGGLLLGGILTSWAFWINPGNSCFLLLTILYLLGIAANGLAYYVFQLGYAFTSGWILLITLMVIVSAFPILFEGLDAAYAIMSLPIILLAGTIFSPLHALFIALLFGILGMLFGTIFFWDPIWLPAAYQPQVLSGLIRNGIITIVYLYSLAFATWLIAFNWMGIRQAMSVRLEKTFHLEKVRQELNRSLEEKDVLLREIHHRVKNNLQIISSLLNLQLRAVEDDRTKEMFSELTDRIRSMTLVHEMLYLSDDLSRVNLKSYLTNLVAQLRRTYQRVDSSIEIDLKIDSIQLEVQETLACGLIINELVTNAFRYAFPGGGEGRIEVLFQQENDTNRLTVRDDGISLPETEPAGQSGALGLKIVHMLVRQLDGTAEIQRSAGTTFSIQFPAEKK